MLRRESLPTRLCAWQEDSDFYMRFQGLRQTKRSPEKKSKILIIFSQKGLDKKKVLCYNNPAERYGPVAQVGRALACHARGRGFEPHPGRQFLSVNEYADLAHLVERHLAKVEVAGSSPVIRSRKQNTRCKSIGCFVFSRGLRDCSHSLRGGTRPNGFTQCNMPPRHLAHRAKYGFRAPPQPLN